MNRNRRYVLISPCRDEARHMRDTLESVIGQSLRPAKWVIVDDGSTDDTPRILADYAARHDWIEIVTRADRGHRSVGPGVIEAFNAGYRCIAPAQFDYLCKLDLDVRLPSGYFEQLIVRMEANPRIATCSGKAYVQERGRLVSERHGDEMSLGMTKFYRVACFEELGGFVPQMMWDGIDCHRCRMHGWIACSWDDPELRFVHLRRMGSSGDGIYAGRARHGCGQYFMGTGFCYMLASAVGRIGEKPYVSGAAAMLWGWVASAFRRMPRFDDPDFRAFLRRYQRRALVIGKRRAVEELQGSTSATEPRVRPARPNLQGSTSSVPAAAHGPFGETGVISTITNCMRMLPPRQRWHWLALVPIALAASAIEAGAAVSIFALIDVIGRGGSVGPGSWAARIVSLLPRQEPRAVLLELPVLVIAYQLVKGGALALAQYYRHRVAHESAADLSCSLLRRYLAAPYPFHFGRNSAELIRNCSHGVGFLLTGTLSASTAVLSEILVGIGLAVVLVAAAPHAAAIGGLVLLAIVVALLVGMRPVVGRRGRAQHAVEVELAKSLQQALGGVKEVKALGRERHLYDLYAGWQRRLLSLGYLANTLETVPALIVETVVVSGAVVALTLLALSGQTGVQTLPLLGLFSYAALRCVPMANRLILRVNEVRGAASTASALYRDHCLLAEADWTGSNNGHTGHVDQALHLDAVSYTYPGSDTPSLRNVSLTIRPGEAIGIVGPTGAGKSTLVDLILGFLSPTAGSITLGNVDLANALPMWRQHTGYVPPAVFLVDDTLRRNIALALPDSDIDEERIRAVVSTAQLGDMVGRLPAGLDTRVGERGVRLSAGEKQRVGIARALYGRPDVLVLDEATAALDGATEAKVLGAIGVDHPGQTLLIVSHRMTAVGGSDRLLLVSGGQVTSAGSLDELMKSGAESGAVAEL